jgi:hypothetical protein
MKLSRSDIVLLKGASMTDLEEAFRRVWFIESRFSSVKQSHGSSAPTASFLLNLEGSLYVNSDLITSCSSAWKISEFGSLSIDAP